MNVTIYTKARAVKDLAGTVTDRDICYFLSDDYLSYDRLRNDLKGKSPLHLAGQAFHEAIRKVETDFLRFCHQIAEQNGSEHYWGTNLASRNSANIPLLKYVVFFHCARMILKEKPKEKSLVFICDTRELAAVIGEEARSNGCRVTVRTAFADAAGNVRLYYRLFLRSAYFLTVGVLKWVYARSLKNRRATADDGKRRYLLRSWVTAGCFDEKGTYKDRNFGRLPGYLEEHGGEVWTVPMYFNLDRSIFAQMRLMADSGYSFLFPEQYMSLPDVFRTWFDGIKGIPLKLKNTEFEGRDFSGVVRDVHLWSSLSTGLLACNAVTYLLKRLKERGMRIDQFIYPIENNAPEKMYIQAVRRYYPEAKLIGFQHTVWFKEQLGVYLHPDETKSHPLPDQVICSGRAYLDIIRKTGFPSALLQAGPNLRYTTANQGSPGRPGGLKSGAEKRVLLILNFDRDQMLEFLDKTGEAFRSLSGIRIRIKSHPLYPVELLKQFLGHIGFPEFEWATGSVPDEVVQSDAVLMTGASVSNLETMITGVPLLRVSLGSNFDFDCLWEEYPFAPFLSSADEIRHYLLKAFSLTEEEKSNLEAFGKKIAADYFEPPTPDNMKVFL